MYNLIGDPSFPAARGRASLPETIRRAGGWCRRSIAMAVRHLRGVPAERWFWLGMAVVMALYVVVFLTQPTGAGRGGR